MPTSQDVVNGLKRALKVNVKTYADVGRHLSVSESFVKRWFAEGRLSLDLDRIDDICEFRGH
jgi:hypothetical protein